MMIFQDEGINPGDGGNNSGVFSPGLRAEAAAEPDGVLLIPTFKIFPVEGCCWFGVPLALLRVPGDGCIRTRKRADGISSSAP